MKKESGLLLLFSLFFIVLTEAQRTASACISNDSVRITYYTQGSGEPILLIPGGPGYGASCLFSLADSLDKVLSRFHDHPLHFTYIIPDLRGTGKSTIPTKDIGRKVNFEHIITDLEAIRQQLGFAHWTVLGHSFGGFLAEYYAGKFPSVIDHLILLSSPDPVSWGWAINIPSHAEMRLPPSSSSLLDSIQAMMKPGNNEDSLKSVYDRIMLPIYVFRAEDTLKLMAAMKNMAVNMQVFRSLSEDFYSAKKTILNNISQYINPVLILHGRMDPMGEGVAYENQKILPSASLQFLGNAGHFLWIENAFSTANLIRFFFFQKK